MSSNFSTSILFCFFNTNSYSNIHPTECFLFSAQALCLLLVSLQYIHVSTCAIITVSVKWSSYLGQRWRSRSDINYRPCDYFTQLLSRKYQSGKFCWEPARRNTLHGNLAGNLFLLSTNFPSSANFVPSSSMVPGNNLPVWTYALCEL